ncbi:unnamed protein product [Orchesella dallaii]|uniref:Activity-regulated cytoskeleton-associated protein n=1 Tax=Orchesella dallaii TaxID=48710 RepID=A0ABP1RJF7_9HEXA
MFDYSYFVATSAAGATSSFSSAVPGPSSSTAQSSTATHTTTSYTAPRITFGTSSTHIPFPHPPSLTDMITQVRKYDGTSDPDIWVAQLESDMRYFHFDYEWISRNLDRFLVGDALKWWSSKFPIFSIHYATINTPLCWQRQFYSITRQLTTFFDQSSQQALNKVKNRKIVFKLGDDPQSYVASKLDILRLCDPVMSESRKIRQLIKGLPFELQQILSLQSITTCDEFLVKLRSLSEVFEENKAHNSHNTSSNQLLTSSKSHSNVQQSQRSRSDDALCHMHANMGRGRRDNRPKGKNNRTPDGRVICDLCYTIGHVKKYCPQQRSNTPSQPNQTPRFFNNRGRNNFSSQQQGGRNTDNRREYVDEVVNQLLQFFTPPAQNANASNAPTIPQPALANNSQPNQAFRNNSYFQQPNRANNLHSLLQNFFESGNGQVAGCGTSVIPPPKQ